MSRKSISSDIPVSKEIKEIIEKYKLSKGILLGGRASIATRTAFLVLLIKKSGMTHEEYIQDIVRTDLKQFIFYRAEMDFIMICCTFKRSDNTDA